MKKLKDKVLEAANIAKECPENLQTICFELLLKHFLGSLPQVQVPGIPDKLEEERVRKAIKLKEPESIVEETAKTQDDLIVSDLHVKVRRFLEKNKLTVDHLNQLFYKEGTQIMPLYDDLKTTRTAESQIRITLLQCLNSAIKSGEFETTVEAVREEAKKRKCNDPYNWGNNYTNNAVLFDFKKYSKKVKIIKLSEQGKTELAEVIKEIQ